MQTAEAHREILNTIIITRIQNKTMRRCTPITMVPLKNLAKPSVGEEKMERKWNFTHCSQECKMVQPPWKIASVFQFHTSVLIQKSAGRRPPKTCAQTFIAALLVTDKKWKQAKHGGSHL
jgi:hypothetical protein